MTLCANRRRRPVRRLRNFAAIAANDSANRQRRIPDRLQQSHLFGGQQRRLPVACALKCLRHHLPRHPDRQRSPIASGGAQLAQLVETGARRRPAPHAQSLFHTAGFGRDAHRVAGPGRRPVARSATRRARSQLRRAAAMSRNADQVPARICQSIRGVKIARRLQVLGDQRGVFVHRSGSRASIAAASRRCISARSDLS